jgi:ribosomal protein S18 acetylase RimI-like enzyme
MTKPTQYTVRNYVKGDEIALARNSSECFGPVTPRRLMEWFRRNGVRPEDIFVGIVDGKLVSGVNFVFKRLHHGEGVYLQTAGVSGVCTDSDYRCKGIVSNLMKLALDKSRQQGLSNASLYTGLDNSAHRIYERLGFVDVLTWRTYIKYTDYPFSFARWLRELNQSLKSSKVARKRLEGWDKSVRIVLSDVGTLAFRFEKNRFLRLPKPPKKADIELSTDLKTYVKIRRGVVQWEDVVKDGCLSLTKGERADVEMLQRILRWKWDE